MDPIRAHGWDLALNHSGLVELDEGGRVTWFRYVTDKPTLAKQKLGGVHLKKDKNDDRSASQIHRLRWWHEFFRETMRLRAPTHVSIEDYAPHAQSNSNYQIGELGGTARMAVTTAGALLRLHDPMSVKMYVAHDGLATPEEMQEAVMDRWPQTKVWLGLPKEAYLDLVVGYSLARMLLDEIALRRGTIQLSSLHPKEVQVFNRVTKANPINLLGREFIA